MFAQELGLIFNFVKKDTNLLKFILLGLTQLLKKNKQILGFELIIPLVRLFLKGNVKITSVFMFNVRHREQKFPLKFKKNNY